MYLYNSVTNLIYFDIGSAQAAYYTSLALQAQMQVNESLQQPIQTVEPISKPDPEESPQIKIKIKNKPIPQKKVQRQSRKKNIRNIIPNIARKIISFICSEDSRQSIQQCFPEMSPTQIEEYYKFALNQKSSLSFYIGNKDLARIWYDPNANQQFLKVARVLSKQFLQNECVNSILLSRRMKPSLKIEHLRYRHRIMRILYQGPKKDITQTE